MKLLQKHPLIQGTLLLTCTGLLSRLVGFFYRIYLSRTFGEEAMGIYQLTGPVMAICFSLTAAGFQTAISRFVAAGSTDGSYGPMNKGLAICLPLSLICLLILFYGSDFIACILLEEPRCAPMLRILSFSVPPSAIHACINGYFYGIKKAGVPAGTQLFEQACRVGCVFLLTVGYCARGIAPSVMIAVLGLMIGEFFSLISALYCFGYHHHKYHPPGHTDLSYGKLLKMILPLTANRLVLNLLSGIETTSIPHCLRLYGYDQTTSLSVYGVLTGMAFPMVFFPNALFGSLSVLLLPTVSERHAKGEQSAIHALKHRTISFCLLTGFGFLLFFLLFGRFMGTCFFHSPLAGYYITTLGLLCPFLYLDTTLSAMLQGLGKVGTLFAINVGTLLLRLGFILYLVPRIGMPGYLWGLLVSQILLCGFYLLALKAPGDTHSKIKQTIK